MSTDEVSELRARCGEAADSLRIQIAERERRLAELTALADSAGKSLADFCKSSDSAIRKAEELSQVIDEALATVDRKEAAFKKSSVV